MIKIFFNFSSFFLKESIHWSIEKYTKVCFISNFEKWLKNAIWYIYWNKTKFQYRLILNNLPLIVTKRKTTHFKEIIRTVTAYLVNVFFSTRTEFVVIVNCNKKLTKLLDWEGPVRWQRHLFCDKYNDIFPLESIYIQTKCCFFCRLYVFWWYCQLTN
jgi:hypothetical protein